MKLIRLSTFSNDDYIEEAARIVEMAKKDHVILRAMGACAVRIHCSENRGLLVKLDRNITDLDFMSYEEYRTRLEPFFHRLGYSLNERFTSTMGNVRQIYKKLSPDVHVDLFFDKLRMSHEICFRNRLEIDPITISLADLILEKAQIVRINEKDVKDLAVLMIEHDVGPKDEETINSEYIADLTSKDWGLYYTITTNLKDIRDTFEDKFGGVLSSDQTADLRRNMEKIIQAIEDRPKTMKWKMRARIGPKQKWYDDVEEVTRGSLAEYLESKKL